LQLRQSSRLPQLPCRLTSKAARQLVQLQADQLRQACNCCHQRCHASLHCLPLPSTTSIATTAEDAKRDDQAL
jgi:hypothetical protein